jgi:hypothetical protein
LYTWRKQMLTMAMAGFVPVQVAPEAPPPMLAVPVEPRVEPGQAPAVPGGVIEVQWSSGVRMRVSSGVDVMLLRSVLAELSGH